MNAKVMEETCGELNFLLYKKSRGDAHDESRRMDYVPCQRARTVGPEEMRQTYCE